MHDTNTLCEYNTLMHYPNALSFMCHAAWWSICCEAVELVVASLSNWNGLKPAASQVPSGPPVQIDFPSAGP